MEQDNFIQEIMAVAGRISKAEPEQRLWRLIAQRINEKKTLPAKKLWLVGASIAVLLALNVTAIAKMKPQPESRLQTALSDFVNKNNELY